MDSVIEDNQGEGGKGSVNAGPKPHSPIPVNIVNPLLSDRSHVNQHKNTGDKMPAAVEEEEELESDVDQEEAAMFRENKLMDNPDKCNLLLDNTPFQVNQDERETEVNKLVGSVKSKTCSIM